MSARLLVSLFLLLLGVSFATHAQQTRVRGILEALDGAVLRIKSAGGGNAEIRLDEKTQLVFMQPIALEEIKPGDFLGVTSMKRADGTLSAVDVRRFAKPVNPGHRPFDGRDDQTMTNASVSATVQAAAGRELTMSYEGGSQKILVPPSACISTLVPGQRSQLVPGSIVNVLAAPGSDGKLVAQQIQFRAP
jgi:hypothetical protein